MKRSFQAILILAMLITLLSCESLGIYSDSSNSVSLSSSENNAEFIETTSRLSPADLDKAMAATIENPVKTIHRGTISDPIPIGEYDEWAFWQQETDSYKKHDYEIRMNVNYSVRGDEALRLYNDFNYDPDDYFYEDYRPTNGYELAIINITVQLDSDENIPASLNPLSFMLSTSSGLGISTNDPNVAYPKFLRYYNLFAGDVYPGARITANLVYEVPVNQNILIGFTDVWFNIAE